MRSFQAALLFAALLQAPPAGARDASQCVDVYNVKRGIQCGSTSGVAFRLRNTCGHPIDVKYCAQKSNGQWDCGLKLNTGAGGSAAWQTCNANGRYYYWGRVAGTDSEFPARP